jgi:hypothetical protein
MLSEELEYRPARFGPVLDEVAVPAAGEQVQLGAGDPLGQQGGVGRGVDEVVGAVDDQHRVGDGGQLVPGGVGFAG